MDNDQKLLDAHMQATLEWLKEAQHFLKYGTATKAQAEENNLVINEDEYDHLDEDELTDNLEYTLWQTGDQNEWDFIVDNLLSLTFKYEKGQPFAIALSLGGPNIWLSQDDLHGTELIGVWWMTRQAIKCPELSDLMDIVREHLDEFYCD